MAHRVTFEPSRSLMEFRLLPRLTTVEAAVDRVCLEIPLVWAREGQREIRLKIPLVAAAMQSVSGPAMGIELAKLGGAAFIYCSQAIDSQVEMIAKIKSHKAGFVKPLTVSPTTTVHQIETIKQDKGFSTFPVVSEDNVFLGLITQRDYDPQAHGHLRVIERMTPREKLEVAVNVTDLKEAHARLVESHQSVLPIVDEADRLSYLVFRKDAQDQVNNPNEVVDDKRRLLAVAAINTHDYKERVAALVASEVDAVAIDSSDGHSVHQQETLKWIQGNCPGLPVIGGNIITEDGFDYLVEAGAQAVKVGMGGGSICITQEQKGTGRGLATALMEVCEARDRYFQEKKRYIPIIADGGVTTSKDVVVALALGADYVMMGRYFARMEESPTEKVQINNHIMKPYWGEGAARARQWSGSRYYHAAFFEGVEGFVEYAGKLRDNLDEMLSKIKAAMSSCGCRTIQDFHERTELELVTPYAIREGQVHDVLQPGRETVGALRKWTS